MLISFNTMAVNILTMIIIIAFYSQLTKAMIFHLGLGPTPDAYNVVYMRIPSIAKITIWLIWLSSTLTIRHTPAITATLMIYELMVTVLAVMLISILSPHVLFISKELITTRWSILPLSLLVLLHIHNGEK